MLIENARDSTSEKLQFEAVWSLTNIASNESQFVIKLVDCNAISMLIELIDSDCGI